MRTCEPIVDFVKTHSASCLLWIYIAATKRIWQHRSNQVYLFPTRAKSRNLHAPLADKDVIPQPTIYHIEFSHLRPYENLINTILMDGKWTADGKVHIER